MSEAAADDSAPGAPKPPESAGSLLRAARQAQNLHIAVLAANLKVPQARLEALEADRLGDMPDATFVRALALAVCRVLKIDAAPVLALMPLAPAQALERVSTGLNTPFRERPGRHEPLPVGPWRQPAFWLVLVLLGAAAVLVLWPGPLPWRHGTSAPTSSTAAPPAVPVVPVAASAAPASDGAAPGALAAPAGTQAPLPTSSGTSLPVANGKPESHAAPTAKAAPVAKAGASAIAPLPAAAPAGPHVVLSASAKTWVQVIDADGSVVVSRELTAGDSVTAQGKLPMRLVIGNAQGTRLIFAGRPIDLAASTRDNVARLELNLP